MEERRSLSPDEHRAMAYESLQRLLDLHELATSRPHVVPSMAVEIWNVFCNPAMQRELKARKFPHPEMYVEERKAVLLLPLVGLSLNWHPPGIEFKPILSDLGDGMRYDAHPFKRWWKKDVAHQPLRAPGEPTADKPIELTRFGLIKLIRNKVGAHHDRDRPKLLDELEDSALIRGWSFDMDGETYRIDDGRFSVIYPYGKAVIRQIAFETLAAFDLVKIPLFVKK